MKEQIKNRIRRYLRVIDDTFYGDVLAEYVREKYDRKDDTILRYLREMKADGELDYEVLNQTDSKYKLTYIN